MLSLEEQRFIQAHADQDPHQIALSGKKYPNFDLSKLASQIQARQKLVLKLPFWASHTKLFFPQSISLEQASSEATANFKANIVHGNVLDASGGMGVDSAAFAKKANQVVYVERQQVLKEITAYNHGQLGYTNIQHILGDGLAYLNQAVSTFDFIYLDPARRNAKGDKVLLFKDCEPNVLDFLPMIKDKSHLLLKTSPLLDLERAIIELSGVDKIWVVCVKNEVKELLFLKSKNSTFDPEIDIIELNFDHSVIFSGTLEAEKSKLITVGPISNFLYEPHPGILKAGFFKLVETEKMIKINSNTHLYSSKELDTKFPGKSFRVIEKGPVDISWLKKHLPNKKVNISTRNFPEKPEDLRKKLKLIEGGNLTLFGYRNHQNQVELALTQKCAI
jgi:16S rRNA G966 N2-methylase RsmD